MLQKHSGFSLKYETKSGVEFYDFMIENCWLVIQISKKAKMNCDFHDFNSDAYVLF